MQLYLEAASKKQSVLSRLAGVCRCLCARKRAADTELMTTDLPKGRAAGAAMGDAGWRWSPGRGQVTPAITGLSIVAVNRIKPGTQGVYQMSLKPADRPAATGGGFGAAH
jgi:hypothetical protein